MNEVTNSDELREIRTFILLEEIRELIRQGEAELRAYRDQEAARAFIDAAEAQQWIDEHEDEEYRYNHNHDSKGRFARRTSSRSIDNNKQRCYNDSKEGHIPITSENINNIAKLIIFDDDELNKNVQSLCRELLTDSLYDPPLTERALSITIDNLKNDIRKAVKSKGEDGEGTVNIKVLESQYISIHNHPSGGTFSPKDVYEFMLTGKETAIVVVGNNGKVYSMAKTSKADTTSALPVVCAYKNGKIKALSDNEFWKGMNAYGIEYREY